MSKLDDKIIHGLNLIGYNGEMLQKPELYKAVETGPKNIDYTKLVNFLTNEIRILLNIDEEVNAITLPEDSVSFIMEITSFLKELNCPYKSLTEGLVSERLQIVSDRLLLLDYLISELMGARIVQEKKPEKKIELKLQETSEAGDMRSILMTLCFSKPPPNITLALLFEKIGPTIELALKQAGVDLIGNPIFSGFLSDKQWNTLNGVQKDLSTEYTIRREMMLTRLDVTIQSFQWSDSAKGKENVIDKIYMSKRKHLKVEPDVDLADLLAARMDLAIIEKTSNSSVRKNTQSTLNKVIIGEVPDRGGRTSEQAPPPPEMPSWQQRSAGPASGGRGGRGGGRGGGYQRGNKQGGDYSARGNSGSYSGGNQAPSFDSAGSFNVEQKYDGGNRNYNNNKSYDNNRGRYDNNRGKYDSNRQNYQGSNEYGGGFDSAGSYGGGANYRDDRRDSYGSHRQQEYEQDTKRVKTYDSFQANKATYADQYVQESQHNQQYRSRGENRGYRGGGGRGRSNYNRGGGNNYR